METGQRLDRQAAVSARVTRAGLAIAISLVASSIGAPGMAQEVDVATAVSLLEGPTVDSGGNVYFTDIMTQRIMRFSREGVLSVYREQSNVANGLVIDPQGRLIAAEGALSATAQRNGLALKGIPRVTRTDLKTGRVEILAETYQGMPLSGPNDVTIDGRGRLYFTDFGGGAVYRIDAPGQLQRILAAPDIQRPNGIQVSPDDSTLYVVEANGAEGGARMIRAYDLLPDGTVLNMRVHYNFYPGRSADGISVDAQGNLYAAAGMHRTRSTAETLDTACGVYVISPAGRLLRFIPIPEDYITNTAFGGPDMKTLYITAGKTLYTVRTDIPGLPR
jgi:gluconolactonase